MNNHISVTLQRLVSQNPKENDLALETCLPLQLKASLETKLNRELNLKGYKIIGPISDEIRAEAIRTISAYCQPPSKTDVIKALTKLMLVTKDRTRSENELCMTFEIYCDELLKYLADIVMYVLKASTIECDRFPTLKDLHSDLKWRSDRRTMMIDSLRDDEKTYLKLVE